MVYRERVREFESSKTKRFPDLKHVSVLHVPQPQVKFYHFKISLWYIATQQFDPSMTLTM